jgi:hypothetical protein
MGACYKTLMSTTGWLLYAPGETWIEGLVGGPWGLEALTGPARGWRSAFFKHCQEQPWEVERWLRTVSGRTAVRMPARISPPELCAAPPPASKTGLLRRLGHQHPEEQVDELPRARHRKDDKDHPD